MLMAAEPVAPNREHYVYVYRDDNGNPVYVGQGKEAPRAGSHPAATHNEGFATWLDEQKGRHRVEIIGPLGDARMADAIETSIISVCSPASSLTKTFFNVNKGPHEFRFRPYGVPDQYAHRTVATLGLVELRNLEEEVGPIMFVRVNQKDFSSGAGWQGYDLANPPPDESLRARVREWWQLRKVIPTWAAPHSSPPALLVGVTGGPGAQLIVASAYIDRGLWATAETKAGGLVKVPLKTDSLDAEQLRGRSISREVQLRFGFVKARHFRVFRREGFDGTVGPSNGTGVS